MHLMLLHSRLRDWRFIPWYYVSLPKTNEKSSYAGMISGFGAMVALGAWYIIRDTKSLSALN